MNWFCKNLAPIPQRETTDHGPPANYYAPFVPKFSHLSTPLTVLAQKSTLFVWREAAQEAHLRIKDQIGSKRTLAILDPERPVNLQTNASSIAWAAILPRACE